MAEQRRNYPFSEWLDAVGGGLRWNTVIGPVRLEYGHNLNPCPLDPSGTIHFSFGFPF
jgi:outer membrane translocation and assembly module TamA